MSAFRVYLKKIHSPLLTLSKLSRVGIGHKARPSESCSRLGGVLGGHRFWRAPMRLSHVSIVFACPLFICVCVSYKTRYRRGLFLLNRSACCGFAVCPSRRQFGAGVVFLVASVFQPKVSHVHEYQLLNFLPRAWGVGLTCETRTPRGPDFSLLPRF